MSPEPTPAADTERPNVTPARRQFLLLVAERQPELRDYIKQEFGVEYVEAEHNDGADHA